MTEKIKIIEAIDVDPLSGARYAIDPVAFALALVLAPIVVAVLGFWALLIPVAALVFGGPLYLVVGTPILLIYLHYRVGSVQDCMLMAFATMLVGVGALWLWRQITMPSVDISSHLIFASFGVFFGPVWAATFARLYNRWRSDISRQPLPPLFPAKGHIQC